MMVPRLAMCSDVLTFTLIEPRKGNDAWHGMADCIDSSPLVAECLARAMALARHTFRHVLMHHTTRAAGHPLIMYYYTCLYLHTYIHTYPPCVYFVPLFCTVPFVVILTYEQGRAVTPKDTNLATCV
ncbi:hypothetical protein K504DRAFT_248561 [Pleomassaria siparia CBS 279.74]|uniref:Uncharacterized protein n=1 Tax=Pleomassaria siparia CBS 279.74 TaxID=1314801 RepID=A0A6G1KBF2_9PLEO|nr:hypothetical protein K504DRAFT_248561 [Pleomassaria siparia CBS 279.74]